MSAIAELPHSASHGPANDAGGRRSATGAPSASRRCSSSSCVSVTNLFIGTVLGVMQTFPGVSLWLRGAGAAGHLIDPLAHAHINLVGGVTMGMMGLFYYVLPRVLQRPRRTARCCPRLRSGCRPSAWASSSRRW